MKPEFARPFFLSLAVFAILNLTAPIASASPAATVTQLAVTANGVAATSVSAGTVVTLTATVTAGGTPVTVGQVKFCDATVAYCTDIHLLATAQLTKAGMAKYKFRPGAGIHSYKAVFAGTKTDAASNSSQTPLTIGVFPSLTGISGSAAHSAGSYTLSAAVSGAGSDEITGTVTFSEVSDGNKLLGKAQLGATSTAAEFEELGSAKEAAYPYLLGAADLNGDGIQDLVVTGGTESTTSSNGWIAILLGSADGRLLEGQYLKFSESTPGPAVLGDFNGDGIADLAVALWTNDVNGNVLTVLLGNGDGTFRSTPGSYEMGVESAVPVLSADFNADGIADLAFINRGSSTIEVLLGNGDGTFTPASPAPVSGSFAGYPGVAVDDFNGDGIPDLAVTTTIQGTPSVEILIGNGDGTFAQAPIVTQTPYGAIAIAAADFNGDGFADLAVLGTHSYADRVTILLGLGDGTFAEEANSLEAGAYSYSMVIGDFNGDGIPDLAVANQGFTLGSVTVFIGAGDGTFPGNQTVVDGNLTQRSIGFLAGDFDGSGISGFAVGDYEGMISTWGGNSSESATASLQAVSISGVGTHKILASYSGDSNHASSSATFSVIVLPPPPVAPRISLNSSAKSATFGTPITLTATITGNSTPAVGTVSFVDLGDLAEGTATLNSNGVATLASKSLPLGTNSVTAHYGGDSSYLAGVSSALTIQVGFAQTISFSSLPTSAAYGTGPITLSATATSKLPVAFSVSGPATFVGNTLHISGAGTVIVTASQAGDSIYLPAPSISQTVEVKKTVLTVTADDLTKVYGAAMPALAAVITGFVNGDTAGGAVKGSPSLSTKATSKYNVGVYPIDVALGTLSALNYSFHFVPGTITVTKAALTVTVGNRTKLYGAALPGLGYEITGFLNGDLQVHAVTGVPALSTSATAASPVGAYPITAALGTLAARDYTFTFVGATLTVDPALLIITAKNVSVPFNQPIPALTYTATGFVNADKPATLTGKPDETTTATKGSPVGTYPITIKRGTLAAKNYTLKGENGTLTITAP